jgi:hypothetical protein
MRKNIAGVPAKYSFTYNAAIVFDLREDLLSTFCLPARQYE